MKIKKILCLLVAYVVLFGCLTVPAEAVEARTLNGQAIMRATDRIAESIPAHLIVLLGESVSLDSGETVTFNCTYTPRSASVDFGLIDSDGHFHYINVTTGSISRGIRVSQQGSYTLAIANNSDGIVTVTGTVNY